MTALRRLGIVGAIAMAAALVYGFGWGGGWSAVGALLEAPWFVVSLVDVYVGFALVGAWILLRERSPLVATAWIVAIMLLGNLVACLYLLRAIAGSSGSIERLMLGARHRAAA